MVKSWDGIGIGEQSGSESVVFVWIHGENESAEYIWLELWRC